jgi:hypothetical protein
MVSFPASFSRPVAVFSAGQCRSNFGLEFFVAIPGLCALDIGMPKLLSSLGLVWVISRLCAPALAADARATKVQIKVVVVNSAMVRNEIVAIGEKEAGYILSLAGIEVVWQNCGAGALAPMSDFCKPSNVEKLFLINLTNDRTAVSTAETLGLVGRLVETGDYSALIFYMPIKDLALKLQVEGSTVLGAAFAHEMGHVLGIGHSKLGIMSPSFSRSHFVLMDQGRLVFTSDQATRLRNEVTIRMQVSNASIIHRL